MNIRDQKGMTLVELLITMAIFVLVIAAVSNIFLGLLTQFKQQSKIAETNIEGMVGLQMLRSDIEQAGYGLPFDINGADYNEAVNDPTTAWDDTAYNDAGVTDAPPRAVLVGNNVSMTNTSDVLVVKATNVALNDAAKKWAYISNADVGGVNQNIIPAWQSAAGAALQDENLTNIDRVIVVRPSTGTTQRVLLLNGANFFTTFNSNPASGNWAGFAPTSGSYETYLVYGIRNADPIMPFNRADYYVRTPGSMPTHCAPGTGILYKAGVNHTAGGGTHAGSENALLDCVAAMKVVLARDTNGDGATDSYITTWPVGTTAADIRSQLKEVRVYILLHEGQRDTTYESPATMTIADPDVGNLLVYNVPDRNYRWKIYAMVVKPYNLR